MTGEDRQKVREANDRRTRTLVEQAKSVPRERKSPVVRAAEKAHRAQDALEIVKTIVPPTPGPLDHCAYCGRPSKGSDVCIGHRDLTEGL